MKAFSALPVSPPSGTSRMMTLILLMALVLMTGTVCFGSPPKVPEPFDISLEPLGDLVKGGPITMSLTYKLNLQYDHYAGDTGSYTVMFLDPRNHKDTLSRTTYPVSYDNTYSHSANFQTILPDADTNYCVVQVSCGSIHNCARTYFIATGDKVEFLRYFKMPFPMDLYPEGVMIAHAVKGGPRSRRFHGADTVKYYSEGDPIRDTLTEENLRQTVDVILNLGDPETKKTAERIIGPIPDSCLYDRYHQYYRVTISLKTLIALADNGVGFEYATPPPWDSKYRDKSDSIQDQRQETDSTDLQGSVYGRG